MIASLFWKEWREQRWKVVGIFTVFAALALAAWVVNRRGDVPYAWQGSILVMAFLVPGFVAMGTITQERSRRTDETMRVLPVGRVSLFACSVLGGVATMWVPLVVSQLICWMVAGARDELGQWLCVVIAECGLMLALYLWILALGARLRNEASLGLLGIGLLCGCGFIAGMSDMLRTAHYPEFVQQIVLELLPTGFATLVDHQGPGFLPEMDIGTLAMCCLIQILEIVPLLLLACWRMNLGPRVARRPAKMEKPAAREKQVAGIRRAPVLWKTWREARLAVGGFLAIAGGFMACAGGMVWWGIHQMLQGEDGSWNVRQAGADMFVVVPGILSILVVILVGVDIGMRDFENRLESFWQSRPICAGGYMAKRFLSGLLVLAPVLLIVPALGLLYIPVTHQLFPTMERWAGTLGGMVKVASWKETPSGDYAYRVAADALAFLTLYVPQALVIYGMSVLCATLTRRRVISLVMGIGCGLALQMLFAMEEMHHVTNLIKEGPGFTEVLVYAGIMAAVTALLGWLAVLSVKLDWRAWFERRVGAPEGREAVVKPLAAGG